MAIKSKKALLVKLEELDACDEARGWIRAFKGTLEEMVHAVIRHHERFVEDGFRFSIPRGLEWVFWLDGALREKGLLPFTQVGVEGDATYTYWCRWDEKNKVSMTNDNTFGERADRVKGNRKAYAQLEADLLAWFKDN